MVSGLRAPGFQPDTRLESGEAAVKGECGVTQGKAGACGSSAHTPRPQGVRAFASPRVANPRRPLPGPCLGGPLPLRRPLPTLTVARRHQATGVRGAAREARRPGPGLVGSRSGTRGRLPTPRPGGKVVVTPDAPHAGPRPRGALPTWARAWRPPARTRGRYLRGHGRGARPAAAGNTGTTRSWPAAALALALAPAPASPPHGRPPGLSQLGPAPGPAPGAAHVVPPRFNNNFIGSAEPRVGPRGQRVCFRGNGPGLPPGSHPGAQFEN